MQLQSLTSKPSKSYSSSVSYSNFFQSLPNMDILTAFHTEVKLKTAEFRLYSCNFCKFAGLLYQSLYLLHLLMQSSPLPKTSSDNSFTSKDNSLIHRPEE
jgi:hypothetical protein